MTDRELDLMSSWVARLEDERDAARADRDRWRSEALAARRLVEARAPLPERDLVGEIAATAARLDALRDLAMGGNGYAAVAFCEAERRLAELGAAWCAA